MFWNKEDVKENSPRERVLHSTYTNKPTPHLQRQAQNSHFNEEGRSSNAFKDFSNAEAPMVPVTWDTVYDPEHPDADWSGLVKKIPMKKHNHQHIAMQESIERTEHGIMTKEDKERQEFSRKRGANDPTISKNAGSLVIGGIDNPQDRFKTTYNRFEYHEKTGRDQLTLEKRINPVKKISDPGQLRSQGGSNMSSPREPLSQMDSYGAAQFAQSQQASFRGGGAILSAKTSLLSGLGGKLIADSNVPTNPVYNQQAGGRPNDNYRVLVTDNYKPFPGYTGRRKP